MLKHHVNSFRETDLKAVLDRRGVEEVVICGAMSPMCVDAGTRAASDLGYKFSAGGDAGGIPRPGWPPGAGADAVRGLLAAILADSPRRPQE